MHLQLHQGLSETGQIYPEKRSVEPPMTVCVEFTPLLLPADAHILRLCISDLLGLRLGFLFVCKLPVRHFDLVAVKLLDERYLK